MPPKRIGCYAFFPKPLPGTEASALTLELARAERRFVDLCGSRRYRSADDYLITALEECSSLADKCKYDDAWGAMDLITAQFIKNRSRPVPLGRVRKMASEALCTHRYVENGDAAAHVA